MNEIELFLIEYMRKHRPLGAASIFGGVDKKFVKHFYHFTSDIGDYFYRVFTDNSTDEASLEFYRVS
jgi:hypothetical protein